MYYNEFDSTNRPLYHLISQFSGYGFQAIIGWGIAGVFIDFGKRQWIALAGILVYELFNTGYAIEWMMYDTAFAEIYPTMETVTTCIFSIFVSSLYIPAWDRKVSKLKDLWIRL